MNGSNTKLNVIFRVHLFQCLLVCIFLWVHLYVCEETHMWVRLYAFEETNTWCVHMCSEKHIFGRVYICLERHIFGCNHMCLERHICVCNHMCLGSHICGCPHMYHRCLGKWDLKVLQGFIIVTLLIHRMHLYQFKSKQLLLF